MNQNQPRELDGRFGRSALGDNGTALPAPSTAHALGLLMDCAFPSLDEADSVDTLTRVEAQRAARKILSSLTDDQFFNDYWFGIESAAMQHQRFANDDNGDEAASASPADTQGVDLGDFFGVEGPDRPGENGYGGYDFAAYSQEITSEWSLEMAAMIDRAVAADASARAESATSAARTESAA